MISQAVFELLSGDEGRLVSPNLVVVCELRELFAGVAHNLLGHQLLDCPFDWDVFALRRSEVTAH